MSCGGLQNNLAARDKLPLFHQNSEICIPPQRTRTSTSLSTQHYYYISDINEMKQLKMCENIPSSEGELLKEMLETFVVEER